LPADADLILLPGTKSTIGDLKYMREQGWDIDVTAHARQGKRVLGLCGGYQMLGRMVHDPEGFEGTPGSVKGLGLLDLETVLTGDKQLENVTARHVPSGETITGYEIHLGRSEGPDCARPFAENSGRKDGAISANGLIEGTYLHGIFSSDLFRGKFLTRLGAKMTQSHSYDAMVDATLDELAAHLEEHVNLDLLLEIANARNVGTTRSEAV